MIAYGVSRGSGGNRDKPRRGGRKMCAVVLSAAPAGAMKFADAIPTARAVGYLLAAAPQLNETGRDGGAAWAKGVGRVGKTETGNLFIWATNFHAGYSPVRLADCGGGIWHISKRRIV